MTEAGAPQTPGQRSALRILLVDDEEGILRVYGNGLRRHGAVVETASNGEEAVEKMRGGGPFDVMISDISMPQMTGLEFLKAVRAHDLHVPVILMTGQPGLESAMRAVEYGACSYLTKPVEMAALWEKVQRAARLHELAALKTEALELPGHAGGRLGERAALEVRFGSALERMWMAFQPVVVLSRREVYGYEALLRSDEPTMKGPADILDAAERLGRLRDLGRAVRARVAEAAAGASESVVLFVNLHSADLNDEELYSPSAPLSRFARRVVLEVTERASLYEVKSVTQAVARLKQMGFRIAVDDLGAGFAGLTSFTQLDPDIVKLDMSLVRGIDGDERLRSIVRAMTLLCDELRMGVIAEGVETAAEKATLTELGCDLLQGYFFAKPQRGFVSPSL